MEDRYSIGLVTYAHARSQINQIQFWKQNLYSSVISSLLRTTLDFQPQEQHDAKIVLFLSHQVSGYLLQKLWETTT